MQIITGNIVDIPNSKIFLGSLTIANGIIENIKQEGEENSGFPYILPGFIDSHVHIESSMLVPSEFAKLAVVHGTVATISDPHEIANVCGVVGVHYMIENGKTVPFKFHFGAPSCVPATIFETAGAIVSVDDVDQLLQSKDIYYLSEMMNFPGVLNKDAEVMQKITLAKKYNKPVDGHAPGLRGETAKAYIAAGISTDHECFTKDEALDKLQHGMKILIREGSAAKNFDALVDLLHDHSDSMMFCSDDKHPDSLLEGHINTLCARAVAKGIDIFKILKAACINPVQHYNMNVGMLQQGDAADFVLVNNLKNFQVQKTFIDGILVASKGESHIKTLPVTTINSFNRTPTTIEDYVFEKNNFPAQMPAIVALDGQLITEKATATPIEENNFLLSNPKDDCLKIVVINRYHQAPIAKAFIKNFGLKKGAIASTVAHDSHNIIAVGVSDTDICHAVNAIIATKGGISAAFETSIKTIGLPVAGLMSIDDGKKVAEAYTTIDHYVKQELGATLQSPFMTLSFMALLVIPHLKLSDKGLFDGDTFSFV